MKRQLFLIATAIISCYQAHAISMNTTIFLEAFSNPYISEQDLIAFSNIPDVDIHAKNNIGQTTLMLAAMHNYEMLASLLIKKNVAVNAPDSKKRTALMFAAGAGSVATVKALLTARAKTNLKDVAGKTAIDYAKPHANTPNLNLLKAAQKTNKNGSPEEIQAQMIRIILQKIAQAKGRVAVLAMLKNHKNTD